MAAYTAFVKVILTHANGDQTVVSKQFDNPQEFVSWTEDATDSYNESIATYDLRGYVFITKVNGQILDVENVSYDSRLNFVVRRTPSFLRSPSPGINLN